MGTKTPTETVGDEDPGVVGDGEAPGVAETEMESFWPDWQCRPIVQMQYWSPADSRVTFAGPVVIRVPIGFDEVHASQDAFGTCSTSWLFVVKLKA